MNISLEKPKLDYISKIKKGFRRCFKKLCNKHFKNFTNPNSNLFKFYITDSTDMKYCFDILLNNNYCGTLIFEIENNEAHICYLFILPYFQNFGIGSKVFSLIEEKFPQINRWYLETFAEEKTCKFYEKNSFKN